jgi:hypothetical protein
MKIAEFGFLSCAVALWLVVTTDSLAQQSPAARQAAKARSYADRPDDNRQTDSERAATQRDAVQTLGKH